MSMEFTAVSLLLLVEGLPAGRRRLVPCVSNLDDQRCHFGLSATTERDRGFADSLLEGDGFEPSVPHTKQPFWVPRSVPQFAFRDKNQLFRAGTDGSNPFPSSGETSANLIPAKVIAALRQKP